MSNDPLLSPLAALWGLPDNAGGQFLALLYSTFVLTALLALVGWPTRRRD
jgi:hypothetical protein